MADIRDVAKQTVDAGLGWGFERDTKDFITRQTFVKKTLDITTAVTASALWTPTSGKKFVVTDIVIGIQLSADIAITLFDDTDTTANRILKVQLDGNDSSHKSFSHSYNKPVESSTADNVLKVTTSANAADLNITVSGYEI